MKIIKVIRNSWGSLLTKWGKHPRLKSPDRIILEQTILPYFNSLSTVKNILFIGCEWFTKHYELYFPNKKYFTIDNNPKKIKYGSPYHICDNVQNIKKYFSENSLDLIICNGVLGWGLDDKREAEASFADFYDCLTRGGIIMIGWNNIPEHCLFLPEETNLFFKFEPYVLPPFNHWRYKTESGNAHIYDFYTKKR